MLVAARANSENTYMTNATTARWDGLLLDCRLATLGDTGTARIDATIESCTAWFSRTIAGMSSPIVPILARAGVFGAVYRTMTRIVSLLWRIEAISAASGDF